jgi:hypothetical protein
LEYAAPTIKEAAAEDYTPIFANKGTGTASEASAKVNAATENGHSHDKGNGNGNGHGNHASGESGEAKAAPSPYTWTPEALERLERAPEGFMRDCTRALIQKHADKIGVTLITLEVAHEGIEQAKDYMKEAMTTGNLKDMIANLTGNSK